MPREALQLMEMRDKALEVIHNLNWLIEPHQSTVELVKAGKNEIVIKSTGPCNECQSDCIGVAFKERLPGIKLVRK